MAKKKRRPDAERQPAVPEKDITQPVPDEPDDAPADLIPEEPELTPAAEETELTSAAEKPETDTAAETADADTSSKPAADADTSPKPAADAAAPDSTDPPAEEQYSFKTLISDAKGLLTRYDLPNMLLTRMIGLYFLLSGFWVIYLRKKFMLNPVENWRDFVPKINGGSMLICSLIFLIAGFATLSCFHSIVPKKARVIDHGFAIFSVLFFDIAMLWHANNFFMTTAVMFVSGVFIYYVLAKLPSRKPFEAIPWPVAGAVVLVSTILIMLFIAEGAVKRHMIFGTACHDFGLFVQMYHYLANGLHAYTTCERDTLLSHFNIHASYIYYLLVPFYKLIPKESTLLIAQAVLAMGGAIPMFLIAKRHKIKGLALILISFAYVFSISIISPCFYDFHENAFLPTLLMWLFYAIDRKSSVLTWVFTVLVCIVKEDAPLYIVCIGLFMFFEYKNDRRMRWQGIAMAALSGVYMLLIVRWLTAHGDGATMTAIRFGNLIINPGGGLGEVVKNVLLDPSYFFSLLIQEQTINFFFKVMLPILFLPFITKKIHRYLLMLPFIIMNLCIGAGYGYAADINYQYIFGPFCLLLFTVILNLDDLGEEKKHDLSILLGSAAMVFFVGMSIQNLDSRISYENGKEGFRQVEEVLDSIPQDGVVCATPFLLPHCADRDYIYLYDFNDCDRDNNRLLEPDRYEYLVYGPTGELGEFTTPILESLGWTLYNEMPGRVVIYHNPNFVKTANAN